MFKFACIVSVICLCQAMSITTVNVQGNVINAFINTATKVREAAQGNVDTNELEVVPEEFHSKVMKLALQNMGIKQDLSAKKVTKDTRGCCLAREYQVMFAEQVFFNGSLFDFYIDYASDQPRRLIAYRINDVHFKEVHRVVMDFNKNASWTIIGEKCALTKIDRHWVEQCLPEDAHYVGGAHVGVFPHEIHVDTYLHRVSEEAEFAISVTENCFPVASRIKIRSQRFNETRELNYFNGEERIRDPELFHLPDSCPEAKTLNDKSDVYHEKHYVPYKTFY